MNKFCTVFYPFNILLQKKLYRKTLRCFNMSVMLMFYFMLMHFVAVWFLSSVLANRWLLAISRDFMINWFLCAYSEIMRSHLSRIKHCKVPTPLWTMMRIIWLISSAWFGVFAGWAVFFPVVISAIGVFCVTQVVGHMKSYNDDSADCSWLSPWQKCRE